jgi:hypothetical protein
MKFIALIILTLFIPVIASAFCFKEAGNEYGVPFFFATIRTLKLQIWPENLSWRLAVTGCNDFIFNIRNGPGYTPHGKLLVEEENSRRRQEAFMKILVFIILIVLLLHMVQNRRNKSVQPIST